MVVASRVVGFLSARAIISATGRTVAPPRCRISRCSVVAITAQSTRRDIRSFGRPDGSLLPEVPPPATPPANPVEVLRARHDAQGFIFTRAPIDSDGASDLLQRLKTVRRLPTLLSARQLQQAAEFVSGFSKLAATAPWTSFTLEVNPLKVGERDVAAVDGLLIVG